MVLSFIRNCACVCILFDNKGKTFVWSLSLLFFSDPHILSIRMSWYYCYVKWNSVSGWEWKTVLLLFFKKNDPILWSSFFLFIDPLFFILFIIIIIDAYKQNILIEKFFLFGIVFGFTHYAFSKFFEKKKNFCPQATIVEQPTNHISLRYSRIHKNVIVIYNLKLLFSFNNHPNDEKKKIQFLRQIFFLSFG